MPDHLVHGLIPDALADVPADAVQVSPLVPGGVRMETLAPGCAAQMTMLAPAGTIERRYALALALHVLKPGGALTALGPKDKGGARLRRELEGFGCAVAEDARKHWRLCRVTVPTEPTGLDEALAAGALRHDAALDLWTQPGVFSWDRIDEGTQLLLDALPLLSGRGADLGCGLGVLTRAALASPAVERIDGFDADGRAIDAARRNVPDARAHFHWHDLREAPALADCDFVLMNPPFHSGGQDDVALGRLFLRRAREALRPGGALWMVANRHLPYEAELRGLFKSIEGLTQSPRFKIYRAVA